MDCGETLSVSAVVRQGFFYEKGEREMEKRLKELGVEIVRSIRMYEQYQYGEKDSSSYLRRRWFINKTFNINFAREVIEDSDIEIHQFIENLSIQMEYREIADTLDNLYPTDTVFPWHKMEGALPKFFTIEEATELLLGDSIRPKEFIQAKIKKINKNEKMIFQIRLPWEFRQDIDYNSISLYGRMVAGILPVNAKLMEE